MQWCSTCFDICQLAPTTVLYLSLYFYICLCICHISQYVLLSDTFEMHEKSFRLIWNCQTSQHLKILDVATCWKKDWKVPNFRAKKQSCAHAIFFFSFTELISLYIAQKLSKIKCQNFFQSNPLVHPTCKESPWHPIIFEILWYLANIAKCQQNIYIIFKW